MTLLLLADVWSNRFFERDGTQRYFGRGWAPGFYPEGAADFILEDVRARLLREADVEEVVVNVVWDPPWTSARLTRAGREALEMWGLAV